MQNNNESSLNQAAEETAGSAGASVEATTAAAGGRASKKKASKKKASKKKASKKKASKKGPVGRPPGKKTSKKKASKKRPIGRPPGKKTSKKKASKKRGRKAGYAEGTPWERLARAAEELRIAALELAEREASQGRKAIDDFVGATRSKLSDIEAMAERGIARLTGK